MMEAASAAFAFLAWAVVLRANRDGHLPGRVLTAQERAWLPAACALHELNTLDKVFVWRQEAGMSPNRHPNSLDRSVERADRWAGMVGR